MRLRGCAGAPEPLLFAYAISIIIPCAGSNNAYVSWQRKALKEQIMHSLVLWQKHMQKKKKKKKKKKKEQNAHVS